MRRALPYLIFALGGPALGADAPLGRLFYTPTERTRLEAERENASRRVTVEPGDRQPVRSRLNGALWRSDGSQTLWLDGIQTQPQWVPHQSGIQPELRARVGRMVEVDPEHTPSRRPVQRDHGVAAVRTQSSGVPATAGAPR